MLLILDCDGVLVDSELLSNGALAEALTAHGHPIGTEETMARFMGRTWADCERIASELLGRAAPPSLEEDYRSRMRARFRAELRAVPGVEAALDAIPSSRCVASNGPRSKMELSLGLTGLLERFEGRIFSAYDVERGKPAPDLFLHAAATMGFEPGECVVVEDSPLGVAAARAAGMRVLGFAARTAPGALGDADAVFAAMEELPELVAAASSAGPLNPGCAPR